VCTGIRAWGVPATRRRRGSLPFSSLRLKSQRPRCLPRGYPVAPNALGERIRRRRLDLGLTQRTLARRLGVREETVHLWELDRIRPLARHYGRLVRVLGFDPEPPSHSLAERLRAARRRAGLTQAELARRLGLDEGTVVQMEAGRRRHGRRAVEAVAAFLEEAGLERRRS
jgi:transcriptional regulator with XRE-family HTH domain